MKKAILILLLFLTKDTFCQGLINGRYITYSGYVLDAKIIIQKRDGGFAFTYYDPFHNRSNVINIDSTGNTLWVKSYEHFQCSDFDLSAIAETADNGFLLAGAHDSTWSFNGNPLWEYLLVKIDSAGSVQWTKTFNRPINNGNQKFTSIIPLPDNGFLVTSGQLQVKTDSVGNILWLGFGIINKGSIALSTSEYLTVIGAWVYKSDSLLNTLSKFQLQASNNIGLTITNVVETMDHNYAFAGIEDSSGFRALSFFKTDTAGNILTSYRTHFPSTSGYDSRYPTCLLQLSDSQFTIIASGMQGGNTSWRIFIIDINGQLIDSKEMVLSSNFVAQTSAAKYNSGDKYAVLLEHSLPWGSTWISIVTLDSNDSSYCGTQSVPCEWISDTLSVQHFPGNTLGTPVFDQDTINLISNSLNQTVYSVCNPFAGVDNYIETGNNLILSPNPTTSFLKIETTQHIDHIELFDLLGEKIPAAADCCPWNVDCRHLPSGIYILQASNGEKVWRGKFIKE